MTAQTALPPDPFVRLVNREAKARGLAFAAAWEAARRAEPALYGLLANRASGKAAEFGFGPKDALGHFGSVVNRLQREKGLGFEAAWNAAQRAEPGLWRLANGRPIHDTMLTSLAAFPVLNRAASRNPDGGFAGAWQALCAEYPERVYVATSSGVADFSRRHLANRGSVVPDPAQWKQALAREAAVFAALEAYDARRHSTDRGLQMWRDEIGGLEHAFCDAIERLQRVNGWTVRQAWDFLKESEPIFWGRFVINHKV